MNVHTYGYLAYFSLAYFSLAYFSLIKIEIDTEQWKEEFVLTKVCRHAFKYFFLLIPAHR